MRKLEIWGERLLVVWGVAVGVPLMLLLVGWVWWLVWGVATTLWEFM